MSTEATYSTHDPIFLVNLKNTSVFFVLFFLCRFISQAVDNRPTIIENKHFLSFLIKNSGQESPLTHFTPISPKSDLFLHVVKTSIVFLQHLILEGERVRRLLDEDFNLFQNGLSSKSALIYLWSSGKRRRKKNPKGLCVRHRIFLSSLNDLS